MRALPPALAEALVSGEAGLSTCWTVTRRDGARLGFTDHDADLVVEDVTCSAASGWTAGVGETGLGGRAGEAEASGVLDSATLAEADIVAGLYDGARVDCWRLLWSYPQARVLLWRGTIARLVRDGPTFRAEIEGPLAALRTVVGRTYGRRCDARLGDDRCRLAATAEQRASGCDKRFATCRDVFSNAVNFQGFPDIPGDDFIAAAPVEGGLNDGGSRR